MKLLKTLKEIVTGSAVKKQSEREKEYLSGINQLRGDAPVIKAYSPIYTPDRLCEEVNCYMHAVRGFRKFRNTDCEVLDVFSINEPIHHSTIYVLKRDYGQFYVPIGEKNIFFSPLGIANTLPATHFRIYEHTGDKYNTFYSCSLAKGNVIVHGVYKERQTATGEFATDPIKQDYAFPIKWDEIPL